MSECECTIHVTLRDENTVRIKIMCETESSSAVWKEVTVSGTDLQEITERIKSETQMMMEALSAIIEKLRKFEKFKAKVIIDGRIVEKIIAEHGMEAYIKDMNINELVTELRQMIIELARLAHN